MSDNQNEPYEPYQPVQKVPPPPQFVRVDRFAKQPLVTYIILGITVMVFLLQMLTQNILGIDLPVAYLAKHNGMILSGQFWRLITPILVHGSLPHIGFNMYALYVFGRNLELQYGHGRFFLLYILSGFAGNVVSFVMSSKPSVGASTAVFGLLVAQGVFIYRNKRFFGERAKPILTNIVFILGINLLLGLNPMIDNWGHFGGLIGGLLFSWTAGPLWEMKTTSQEIRLVDQHGKNQVFLGVIIVIIAFMALSSVRWF